MSCETFKVVEPASSALVKVPLCIWSLAGTENQETSFNVATVELSESLRIVDLHSINGSMNQDKKGKGINFQIVPQMLKGTFLQCHGVWS